MDTKVYFQELSLKDEKSIFSELNYGKTRLAEQTIAIIFDPSERNINQFVETLETWQKVYAILHEKDQNKYLSVSNLINVSLKSIFTNFKNSNWLLIFDVVEYEFSLILSRIDNEIK